MAMDNGSAREYLVSLTISLLDPALDAVLGKQGKSLIKRLQELCRKLFIIYFPIFVVVVLLIDFNIFAYPRLLENSLRFIFGDIFTLVNKGVLYLIGQTSDTISTTTDVIRSSPTIVETQAPQKLIEAAGSLQYSGTVGEGLTDSTSTLPHQQWLTRIWWVYKYNLPETDISSIILPLTLLGLWLRGLNIKENIKKAYASTRPDVIMLAFLLLFLWFNYHEADNQHGFRITIPILIPLLYFAVYGIQELIERPTRRKQISFIILTGIVLTGYWTTTLSTVYGSVLANASWLSVVFTYKQYIFLAGYIVIAILLLLYAKINTPYKYVALSLIAISFFTVKAIPYYLDYRLSIQVYGYNYGLQDAVSVLEPINKTNKSIYSNAHPYKLQYYANDPYISNAGISPTVRKFNEHYPEQYFRFAMDDNFISSLSNFDIKYVFIVNDKFDESELETFQQIKNDNPGMFKPVREQYMGDRLQWRLYKVRLSSE